MTLERLSAIGCHFKERVGFPKIGWRIKFVQFNGKGDCLEQDLDVGMIGFRRQFLKLFADPLDLTLQRLSTRLGEWNSRGGDFPRNRRAFLFILKGHTGWSADQEGSVLNGGSFRLDVV